MYLPYTGCTEFLDRLAAERPNNPPWLLLFSDRHAEAMPDLLATARERGMNLFGGIFPGLINGRLRADEGCVAMPLPEGSRLSVASLEGALVSWREPLPAIVLGEPASALVFADCLASGITGFLETLFDHYGNHIDYAGAGTGFRDLRRAPSIFCNTGFVDRGALFVLLPRKATVNVQHGWTRVAGPFIATRARGNIIEELDWSPAGPFYRAQVEALAPALRDKPVFPDINSVYPLCIGKEGGEDVMHDPMYIGDAGEIAVLSDVTENSAMYLAHGDAASLLRAARQAVVDCGTPEDVDAVFVSDCYSRALMLGDGFGDELAGVAEALAAFTPVQPEGVLALGEVAANRRGNLEFYNKTFVVALCHQ